MKLKPCLILGHFGEVLKYLENKKDKKDINELLQKEGIAEVIPASQQFSHSLIELYIITQFSTVLFISFDVEKQIIKDPILVNEVIKEILNYRITRIRFCQNINIKQGGPGLTILIGEHDLLCQIRIQDDQMQRNIMNMKQNDMIIGLQQLNIEKPQEIIINNLGTQIMVSNQQNIQILKSQTIYSQQSKIIIESMLIVSIESIPIQNLFMNNFEQITFNLYEQNSFYIVGEKNLGFDQSQNQILKQNQSLEESKQSQNSIQAANQTIIFEKFYVNQDMIDGSGQLTSQTLAVLQLGVQGTDQMKNNIKSQILNFSISQNHEYLCIFTSQNKLLTYKIAEILYKDQNQANDQFVQINEENGQEHENYDQNENNETNLGNLREEEGSNQEDNLLADQMISQIKGSNQKSMLVLDTQEEENEDTLIINQSEMDEVRPLRPIGYINNFINQNGSNILNQISSPIVDIKWILNDTFLMILTQDDQILYFDPLLQIFQIQMKNSESSDQNYSLDVEQAPSYKFNSASQKDLRIFGFRNEVNSVGLPIITNNQFIGVFDRKDPKLNLLEGCDKKLQLIQLCNNIEINYDSDRIISAYSSKFLVQESLCKSYSKPRINHAFKLIYNCLGHEQPEIWLSCVMQLVNKCLVNPHLLTKRKISKEKLFALYKYCSHKIEFEYFLHTVKFLYIKLCYKYLTLEMIEDAVYLAIKTDLPELINQCKKYANHVKNIAALHMLNYHEQIKLQESQEQQGKFNIPKSTCQTNLIRSMSQVANFTKKILKKEDYLNLFKDFDTLLKINDIGDLELTDFNGWGFDLEQYQEALKYELSGEFDKALKIYTDNKIHSDIERVKMLKKEIYKEIRDGEKNLYMHNVADLFSKMP